MNQLTQIEAARVISILKTTSDNLKVLLDVHLDIISSDVTSDMMENIITDEVLSLLLKQKENEIKYQHLFEVGKEYKEINNRAKIRENLQEISEVGGKIKENCQTLQRKLKESPGILDQFRAFPRSDTGKKFIEVFDLLVKLSKVRLETTVEEELEKIKRMEVLAAKESKILSDKISLKKELDAEEKTRSKEIQQLRENEQRLSAQVQKIKADNKAFLARVNANLIAMKNELEQKRVVRIEELKGQNEQLKEELVSLLQSNRIKERELRKTKQQTALEVENRISYYDHEMGEVRNQHIEADKKWEDERLQQAYLEEDILGLDRRKKMDDFKAELKKKQDQAEQDAKVKRHNSIGYIQAMFRRRQCIKAVDALKKAAARKAKSKKKGKKKKK